MFTGKLSAGRDFSGGGSYNVGDTGGKCVGRYHVNHVSEPHDILPHDQMMLMPAN